MKRLKGRIALVVALSSVSIIFLLSIYVVKQERDVEIELLNKKISRMNQLLQHTSIDPLWEVDAQKLEFNLNSIFMSEPEILTIDLYDVTGEIRLNLRKEIKYEVGMDIKKKVTIEKGGLTLGEATITYTTAILEKKLNNSKTVFVLLILGLLISNAMIIIYGRLKESELRVSEDKFRQIYNNILDVYYEASLDGTILEISPSIEKLSQYKREELIGKSLCDIYTNPSDKDKFVAAVINTGKIRDCEIHLTDKVGCQHICSMNIELDKDQKGNPRKIIGIFRDITERKQTETELRRSEEQYREYFEENISGSYISSPDGQLIVCNQEYKRIFGFESTQHALDTPIRKLFADPGERVKFLDLLKKEKRVIGHEPDLKKVDGKSIHLIENASGVFDAEGNLKHIRGFLLDVTEQRKLENQLRQAQKMEAIGTLAGGIAHDFNNILFPILGYSEMLLQEMSKDNATYKKIEKIYVSAQRARDLVKQILTFARQENYGLKLMKLPPLIEETLKFIRSTIPASIEIKQEIQQDCGMIKADPTQIHQILINLTTNAYHAMENTGGKLKVSLQKIELDVHETLGSGMKHGIYNCLIIADTGVGMDKNLEEKFFDPFFTTKEKGKGTGMGLSIVHGIVKNMNGEIKVYSKLGRGTEFHLYLPVINSSDEQPATKIEASIQRGTERILLVDDEEAIATMGKQMLVGLGYHVESHTSSIEALEAFRANPDKFDLVLTDMEMPNMSGDILSAELIKICPVIPILLFSGFSEIISEEKAASLGIKGFLVKPILMKDLARKIRDVLDN